MYCLTDMCYVCLEKKENSLININSSLSVNKDIIHIIGYLPFNLGWMRTKQIILICEECCRRLRETYQLLAMCLKNSAVLQGYMAKINMSNTDTEAELRVDLNNKQDDISEIKCEIKLEPVEMYTVGSIIEESDQVFVNVDDHYVKVEYNWQREEGDGEEESPMDSNSIESSYKELDTEIAVNSNDTDTDSDSSEFTPTQVHTKKLNTAAKKSHICLTCSKSFTKKTQLQIHTLVHKGGIQFKCAMCAKCFRDNCDLQRHERTHNGEKPYKCSVCKKCYKIRKSLVSHMITHTGAKLYRCSRCNKSFFDKRGLPRHVKICTECGEEFCSKFQLQSHMLVHIQ